jgi:hypothetical protein
VASSADDIRDNAVNQPKSVLNDGFRAEQHSIDEQIEADRYAQANKAASRPGFGLSFQRHRHKGGSR